MHVFSRFHLETGKQAVARKLWNFDTVLFKEHMPFKSLSYVAHDATMVAKVNRWLLRKNLNDALNPLPLNDGSHVYAGYINC